GTLSSAGDCWKCAVENGWTRSARAADVRLAPGNYARAPGGIMSGVASRGVAADPCGLRIGAAQRSRFSRLQTDEYKNCDAGQCGRRSGPRLSPLRSPARRHEPSMAISVPPECG